jgi:hypothetical protein
LAQYLIVLVFLITYLPIASQENPWFFPCIKGGAGIFFLFFQKGDALPVFREQGGFKTTKGGIQ